MFLAANGRVEGKRSHGLSVAGHEASRRLEPHVLLKSVKLSVIVS